MLKAEERKTEAPQVEQNRRQKKLDIENSGRAEKPTSDKSLSPFGFSGDGRITGGCPLKKSTKKINAPGQNRTVDLPVPDMSHV